RGVPKPLLNVLAPHDRRQRQCERQPKAAAEHLDAVAGVLVVCRMLARARPVMATLPCGMLGVSVYRVVAGVRMAGVSSALHHALPASPTRRHARAPELNPSHSGRVNTRIARASRWAFIHTCPHRA